MNLFDTFIIKDGLSNNKNFVIKNNDDKRTEIFKKLSFDIPSNEYFECTFVNHHNAEKITFMTDKIICDPAHRELVLLNSRKSNNKVVAGCVIRKDEIVLLYPFGSNAILIIIEEKENQE